MNLSDLKFDKKNIETLLLQNGVSFAAFFGSYAKGTANEKSDVDIVFEFKNSEDKSYFDMLRIKHQVEDMLQKKVDFVPLKSTHPFMKSALAPDNIQLIYDER